MMKLASLIVLLFVKLDTISGFNLILKKIEQCDPNVDYDFSINVTPTLEGRRQFLSGNTAFKSPLTNDVALNVVVKMAVNKKFHKILNFGEKHGCTAIHKYLGEFVYDLERGSGLPPGHCPIPRGVYRLQHHEINTNKITLQSFPLGNLQFVSTFTQQGKVKGCTIIEVDNV